MVVFDAILGSEGVFQHHIQLLFLYCFLSVFSPRFMHLHVLPKRLFLLQYWWLSQLQLLPQHQIPLLVLEQSSILPQFVGRLPFVRGSGWIVFGNFGLNRIDYIFDRIVLLLRSCCVIEDVGKTYIVVVCFFAFVDVRLHLFQKVAMHRRFVYDTLRFILEEG